MVHRTEHGRTAGSDGTCDGRNTDHQDLDPGDAFDPVAWGIWPAERRSDDRAGARAIAIVLAGNVARYGVDANAGAATRCIFVDGTGCCARGAGAAIGSARSVRTAALYFGGDCRADFAGG